ncbi:MAG: hypothetical protein R2780_08630 [Crocinitomicaceae bacterium]
MKFTLLFLLVFPISVLAADGYKVVMHKNETTNKVTVELGDNVHASMIQIIGEDGTVYWTEHKKENEFTLNMKFFPPGVYNIRVSIFDEVQNYTFVRKEFGY